MPMPPFFGKKQKALKFFKKIRPKFIDNPFFVCYTILGVLSEP